MEQPWPVIDGSFLVGDPSAPVAVCTLTSEHLPECLVGVPGVAIAGQVYTANLGIERIIRNITANPSIRFLVVCGKDSKLFRPGQSLGALGEEGIDGEGRIVGALGYDPVLPEVPANQVMAFRRQVEFVDWIGEEDPVVLAEQIEGVAARNPGRFDADQMGDLPAETAPKQSQSFLSIRPGGRREPLEYDSKGYFVITIDRGEEEIVVQHYLSDHTAAHEMRGRVGESMLLGLLREGLVSQLSHAGYLGAELAKAQAALHLDLRYRQDRPLQPVLKPDVDSEMKDRGGTPPMPRVALPLTLSQLRTASEGSVVDATLQATDAPSSDVLTGVFLEPDEKAPFNSFHRTDERVTVHRSDDTQIVMGELVDVVAGGIFRAHGALRPHRVIDASRIVVLTNVATVE